VFAAVALAIGVYGIRWMRSNARWPDKHPVC